MRVDLRRTNVRMSKLLLHRTYIHPAFEQVSCKRMPKSMTACGFLDTRLSHCPGDGPLHGILSKMVTPDRP